MMKVFRSSCVVLLSVVGLFFVVGCGGGGGSDQPELGTVSGVVKLDGQPLANVIVTFTPENGRASNGKTDAEGQYELAYLADAAGAVIGTHTVRITTPQDAPTPPGQTYKDPVPAKYNEKTTLKEEVKAGANEINFDLSTK